MKIFLWTIGSILGLCGIALFITWIKARIWAKAVIKDMQPEIDAWVNEIMDRYK